MAFKPFDGSDHATQTTARRGDGLALAIALLAPIVVGYFGVVRPTTVQLGLVRTQVARLEATLNDLKAKGPAAERSAALLDQLAKQESVAAAAERSLYRVDRLQQRVARSVSRAERSAEALDRLEELRERIDQQTALVERANAALATLAELPAQVEAAIGQASRGPAVVERARRLRDSAAEADRLTDEALASVDAVVATQQLLLGDAESLATANETLDGLAKLESRLNAPLMAVDASHERLDELMRLKDAVVAQTANLPEAFETLDLMVDLSADYQRASGLFLTLRRLMADLVLLEPTIARVAGVVEPLTESASLGHLGGSELRLVLRELRRRHVEAVAEIDAARDADAVAEAPGDTQTK